MFIPMAPAAQEIRDKFFDYAGKVKAVDPNAIVLGPEEFGWSGYFNSGADLQYGGTYGWRYLAGPRHQRQHGLCLLATEGVPPT